LIAIEALYELEASYVMHSAAGITCNCILKMTILACPAALSDRILVNSLKQLSV